MTELRATVSGAVQGVGFRAYVQDAASALGLVGTVRNCDDGTVVVVAQGQSDVLKDFVEYLHEGSVAARVDSVAVEWGMAELVYDEFSILYL